jgi:hypothetical protein
MFRGYKLEEVVGLHLLETFGHERVQKLSELQGVLGGRLLAVDEIIQNDRTVLFGVRLIFLLFIEAPEEVAELRWILLPALVEDKGLGLIA